MPMSSMHDVWDVLIGLGDLEIEKTYWDKPFVVENFGLVLMNDRGSNLRDEEFDLAEAFFPQLFKIMTRAMLLCAHLPHGDVLPHNIVRDEESKELTLIDIDEGVNKPPDGDSADDVILKRKNEYGGGDLNWFIALRYPNPLRTKSRLYTQSQLIATFLSIMGQVNNPPHQTVNAYNELHERAKLLGEFLYDLDKMKKEAKILPRDMETMTQLVSASHIKLDEIVREHLSGGEGHLIRLLPDNVPSKSKLRAGQYQATFARY